MRLHEEFKLFEEMWEDDFNSNECGTSSIEVGLDGYQGERLLDKAGIPHREAYEELLKVLKSVADKDLTELFIYWVADNLEPGDKDGDVIVNVDGFQELIDDGADIEDAEKRGYDSRIPVNRLILPYAYSAADLGLPEDAFDVIEAELTPVDKRGAIKYAVRFRDDQASAFYIGSKEDCQRIAEVSATSDFAKKHGGVIVGRYYG
jgi:hypothetical protein